MNAADPVPGPGPAPRVAARARAEPVGAGRGLVLLTGATGYVGGRLLPRLERAGWRVRCLARRPEALAHRRGPHTEVVRGDLLTPESLEGAFQGVDTAFYLVHSMGSAGGFEERDRAAAEAFGRAARAAGVRRIVYLGGLAGESVEESAHLRSRHEVGRVLRESGVPVVEFRASIILGPGSLSFELVRALVERLPVMVTPRWVRVEAQPIAITDVLAYLLEALERPVVGEETFEIGGADVVTYEGIMRAYARRRGLSRWMVPVPFLTPRLSSLWLGLVTPVYARVGRKLIDGIRYPSVVRDPSARAAFRVRPLGHVAALEAALAAEDEAWAATRWCDALSAGGEPPRAGGVRFGTRLVDSRVALLPVPPDRAFAPVARIGGGRGWYCGDLLWRARGYLDLLVGGVGLRRGRRDPEVPHVGDALDFWRVEAYEPGRRLRLAAEMRLPGRAWLEFETEAAPEGARLRQTAIFDPRGLFGLLYWYALWPLHDVLFRGMLRGIAKRALRAYPASRSSRAAREP